MGNEFQNLKFDGHCLITNYDTRYDHRKDNKATEGILISAFDSKKNIVSGCQDSQTEEFMNLISRIASCDGDASTFSAQDLVLLKTFSDEYPIIMEYLGIKSVRYDEKREIATIKYNNGKLIRMDFSASQRGDWDTFNEILYSNESKGCGGYKAEHPRTHFLGKYQLGEKALADIGWYEIKKNKKQKKKQKQNSWQGTWTEKARKMGVKSKADFKNNPEAQEAAHREYKELTWKRYIKGQHLDKYVGKIVDGCYITEAGLLAGAHLIGPSKLRDYLKNPSPNAVDGNGTHVSKYIMAMQNCDVSEITGPQKNVTIIEGTKNNESENLVQNEDKPEDKPQDIVEKQQKMDKPFGLKPILPLALLGATVLAGPKLIKSGIVKNLYNKAKTVPFSNILKNGFKTLSNATKTVATSKFIAKNSAGKKLLPYMIGALGMYIISEISSCDLKNLYKSSRENDELEPDFQFDPNKSALQNIIDTGQAEIKEDGDFHVVSYDYTIKPKDTLYGIAQTFGMKQNVLVTNNQNLLRRDDEGNNIRMDVDENIFITYPDGEILKRDNEGNITIIDKNGDKLKKDKNGNKIKEDKDGNLVKVDKDGNIIKKYPKEDEVEDKYIYATVNPNLIEVGDKLTIRKLCYKVKKGDTLGEICDKFGVSMEIVKDINNLENINEIEKGQLLEIPGFFHIINNESMQGLARKLGMDINKLVEINEKEGKTFENGDTIKVVYNDADFDIPETMRKRYVDSTTNENIEIIDVSKEYKVGERKLIKEKKKVNGHVVATREVLTADHFIDETIPQKDNKLSGKTIIVNAGHGYSEGGVDVGAKGQKYGMPNEWYLNYDNAIDLAKELCSHGAKVIFLQGKVELIQSEVSKTSKNKADMFISVHVNSSPQNEIKDRMGIYYRNKDVSGAPKENSINFSKLVSKNFTNAKGKVDNVKCKPDTNDKRTGVLKTPLNEQKIPGIIWEVAFMNSSQGRARLKNHELIKNYSEVMAKSLMDYFDIKDSEKNKQKNKKKTKAKS